MFKKCIEHFGDLMEVFHVDFMFIDVNHSDDGKGIIKILNEKCSKSLKYFYLKNCKGNVLNDLTNTFEQVTELTFSIDLVERLELNDKTKKLCQFFSKVERLILSDTKNVHWEFINGKFPSVKYLDMDFHGIQNAGIEIDIANFLRINKHTENLQLTYFNEYVNSEPKGDLIHFENVKDLNIVLYNGDVPDNIVFDQLRTLSMVVKSDGKWSNFIDNQEINTKLNKFYLFTKHLTPVQFLNIKDKFSNLHYIQVGDTEVSLLSDNDVIKFVKNSKQLKELSIHFKVTKSINFDKKKIEKALESDWIVYSRIPTGQELFSLTISR